MHPWLCNVQLVDVAASRIAHNVRFNYEDEMNDDTPLAHVEMSGDGWGSSKATQLVLNNLFYLTAKVRALHTRYDTTCLMLFSTGLNSHIS